VCPACRSPDLAGGEAIHHYRCGTVAPEQDFTDNVCPGCRQKLRTLGTDHERPATLVHCRACGTLSQEGVTEARCLACGRGQLAHEIPERTLHSYQLTADGAKAAQEGRLGGERR
jgi:hypothetical protein